MSKEKTNSQSTKKTTRKKKNNPEEKIVTEKVTKTKTKSKDTKKPIKEKEVKEAKKETTEEIIEDLYDEDLEDSYEEEVVNTKAITKPNKKGNKKEKISTENIKKIEKKAKEKNKSNKLKYSKLKNIGMFLELHRNVITSFIVGVLITVLIAIIIWPERIAALKDGTEPIVKVNGTTYTADDLYKEMKNSYSVSKLLDIIDNDLLTKLYEEDDEMTEEVNSNAEYYLNMYQQYYNYTEEQFLSANGFANYDAFLEYLKLDYRRNKYLDEYVEKNLTDKEIEEYYNENVYGDINCQHILIETSSDDDDDSSKLSDDDAKALAEEIIDKINDGTSWKDIQEEYKDQITFEDLGYQSWDADLEDSFKNALKDMDNDSFSEEPVKTSYGYHVIYRLDQKETPSLEDTQEKITEELVEEKKSDDSNLLYKALINLRDEKEITFSDTDMKAKYDAYKKEYK